MSEKKEFLVFNQDIGNGKGLALKTHLATSKIDLEFLNKNQEHLTHVIDMESYRRIESSLLWLVKHAIDTASISRAKGAELLGVPLIDLDIELQKAEEL